MPPTVEWAWVSADGALLARGVDPAAPPPADLPEGATLVSYPPVTGAATWDRAQRRPVATTPLAAIDPAAVRGAVAALRASRQASRATDTTGEPARMGRLEDLVLALAAMIPGIGA